MSRVSPILSSTAQRMYIHSDYYASIAKVCFFFNSRRIVSGNTIISVTIAIAIRSFVKFRDYDIQIPFPFVIVFLDRLTLPANGQ